MSKWVDKIMPGGAPMVKEFYDQLNQFAPEGPNGQPINFKELVRLIDKYDPAADKIPLSFFLIFLMFSAMGDFVSTDANILYVDYNYDGDGGFTRAPTFVNTQGSEAGDFLIIAKFVGTTGVAEDIEVAVSLDGGLNIDYLKQTKTYNASAVEAETILMGVITVYRGQRVGLWVRNKDGSNNISAGEGTFLVQRLKYYDL